MPNQLNEPGFSKLHECLGKQDRLEYLWYTSTLKKTTYLTVYHACGLSILFFPPWHGISAKGIRKAPL